MTGAGWVPRYGEFEIQAGDDTQGFRPWLLIVHKPCGVDVLPIEWEELDLEVANSFAFNHLKECPGERHAPG